MGNKISILKRDLFSLSKRYEISNKMYQRLNLKKLVLKTREENFFENKLNKNFSYFTNNLDKYIFEVIIKPRTSYQKNAKGNVKKNNEYFNKEKKLFKKPKSYFEMILKNKSQPISKKNEENYHFGVKWKINLYNKYKKMFKRLYKIKKLWTTLELLIVNKQYNYNKIKKKRLVEDKVKKKFKNVYSIVVNKKKLRSIQLQKNKPHNLLQKNTRLYKKPSKMNKNDSAKKI